MTAYRLRAIRLVNFHNFVDETIEVRDGGHLFLLGDNGSGKTTVLDAVHFVLAGGDLELNAAARVGGRREEGRSLQGVVLRYDFERGVRNDAGAIAYAAIELVDDGGRCLSLGVGAEATTMEARVARWGFVVNRALAEVSLLDGDDRPVDREALRRQLGATHVHPALTSYRKELARRLFASEAQYAEAVRFWGMAKAYREIVAGARDFGALFERLLPTPDGAVFEEILATLRAIDDLEVALRDLDAQRAYCGGLADRVRDVAVAREAAARYQWLAFGRERDELIATGQREADAAAEHTRATERLRLDAEAARLRSEGTSEILRQAASADAAGVLGALRELEARRAPLAIEVARARAAVDDAVRTRERAAAAATAARTQLARDAERTGAELRAAVAAVAELPSELATVARLAGDLERLAQPAGPRAHPVDLTIGGLPDTAAAAAETDTVRAARERSSIEARVHAADAGARQAARAAALHDLEAAGPAPMSGALSDALCALAAAAIPAQPLYELLEPAPDADPAALAAIESLAGDAVLGAIVVSVDDRDHARAEVAAVAPGVRVLVATCDAALPAWCATALVSSAANETARSVLAAALAQPAALGGVAPPQRGDVTLRGLGHRVEHARPRWLGADARRRAYEARLAVAQAALAEAEAAQRDALRRVDATQLAVDRAQRLARAVAAACGALVGVWHDARTAADRAVRTAAAWREADDQATSLAAGLDALDGQRDALRAGADGVDLDELDRRLAGLRRQAERARDHWHERVGAHATRTAEARGAAERSRAALARAAALAPVFDEATRTLRTALTAAGADPFAGDDAALAHHVRVTLRGDSFRSLDTLRQRVVDEQRGADLASADLDGDGSRGVRLLAHAARFGFGYDRARNHVEDRRGQPLAGVLADLDRSIAEQRSVVTERSITLMDTLVMGELARHLQGQVHHLHETVKGINRVLHGLRFGPTEYQFQITPRPDRADLIELVRRLSILDEDSRRQFRAWVDARLDELRAADDQVPALLDYRRWFEFKLRMRTTDAEGVELTNRLRNVGSGGEQGVPNYLLVLALAKLMFDAAGAAIRPLLFDEAFYGIDAGRRDQLLRLATDLGLQLLVASPDQDGATLAVRAATTLFVVKDADHDVHLAPYHFWNAAHDGQPDLFIAPSDPCDAACRGGAARAPGGP